MHTLPEGIVDGQRNGLLAAGHRVGHSGRGLGRIGVEAKGEGAGRGTARRQHAGSYFISQGLGAGNSGKVGVGAEGGGAARDSRNGFRIEDARAVGVGRELLYPTILVN